MDHRFHELALGEVKMGVPPVIPAEPRESEAHWTVGRRGRDPSRPGRTPKFAVQSRQGAIHEICEIGQSYCKSKMLHAKVTIRILL